ncbi:unnamed protein product, partial [Closterium sp. Naga37s-1]
TPLCANRGAFFQLSEKVTKWCDSVEATIVQWIIDFAATRAIAFFVLLNPRLSSHQQFRLHQMMAKAVERSWLRRKLDVRLLKGILALACPNRDLLNLIDYLSDTAASLCESQTLLDLQISSSDICLHAAPGTPTCQPDHYARSHSLLSRPSTVITPPQNTGGFLPSGTSPGLFASPSHSCSGASSLHIEAKVERLQNKHCPEVAISIGSSFSCNQADEKTLDAGNFSMGAAAPCDCDMSGKKVPDWTRLQASCPSPATALPTITRPSEGRTGAASGHTARESAPSTHCPPICHSQPLLRNLQQTSVFVSGHPQGGCLFHHPLALAQSQQSENILRGPSRLAAATSIAVSPAAAATVPAAAAAAVAPVLAPAEVVSPSPPLIMVPGASMVSIRPTPFWWLLTEWFCVDHDLVAAMPPAVQRSVLEGLCGDHMDGMLRLVHAASAMLHTCCHQIVLPELFAWFREHPSTCCISLEPLVSQDGRVCSDVVAVVQRTRKRQSSGNHASKQPKLHA